MFHVFGQICWEVSVLYKPGVNVSRFFIHIKLSVYIRMQPYECESSYIVMNVNITVFCLTVYHCVVVCVCVYIGLMSRVFANSPSDWCSIQVIAKTQKMVLDAPLLNTWHYKAPIKGIVGQSRERSSTLPYTSVL